VYVAVTQLLVRPAGLGGYEPVRPPPRHRQSRG
jgi:hypothetical protein